MLEYDCYYSLWLNVMHLFISDTVGIQNPRDQRLCLDLGKKAGLDIAVITKSVVEQIRNTGLVRRPALPGG